MASISFHIPVAIILLGGGLLACFFGYRLFRILLAVNGFMVGVVLSLLVVSELETWIVALVTVGSGIIGALLAIAMYLAGVAFFGAALGAIVLNGTYLYRGTEPNDWLMVAVCLAGALLALALRRYVIIFGTSFAGAWVTIIGGLALAGNTAAIAVTSGDIQQLYSIVPTDQQMGFMIGWIGLSALAVLMQFRATGWKGVRAK